MNINLQGKNFELTPAIRDYISKKVTNLEKLLSSIDEEGAYVVVNFEVGRSSMHHKGGDIFHSDCLINIDGQKFYSSSDKEDIYQAVDEVKEELFRKIRKSKERKQTLYKRGASSVKKMLKGLSKRNPFTSKY
ncbi:MAG: Sigma 54 modulation protein/ribosomal protein S30EA [Candidatus Nomurabacteria bacterium GW2011_GWE1_32_28]|uniref:Sigma 54 modulation protein/ribosomal protein S30EA n=1 Tax=Candidatus Nomurabacteria bacterium GW2011_GWF1_31_48 TaxID=1618767 RepID=A0A0G0BGH1_9BACT|nr:MAG: Sigma 54 modulation protein/ribosomal protein S30EA [Candidatus Nomurabacteria bacterium GW2011_GWF2_30_133]KKP28532.1 MAG: Sigma 54 modulation protein/ribosomal protein S30EA [Candidatus Nomurabacteria bacterium GW2011_GWE2_31_40]KKP30127.1 MAG: Sigma 54 modulation protein/ribosomal protein S30EA [Candidatus Nomurabacteria bacterium GW2011_GWF1_31_48]KKP34672.1 MAG: Sigma 54 modulation protein/ribosomal protein S30EA [Candidatus Nomurabacteria bacterium GW2011_GWE1_32_28]HAS80867.1 rib